MPLLQLISAQILIAKSNPNIMAANRMLRNPVVQVLISFVVGYYATTKITQIFALITRQCKNKCNLESISQLDMDSKSSPNLTECQMQEESGALRLTGEQLSAFNGVHVNQPIYTALNGNIYDLSSSRDTLSQSGLYSLLAGCNANQVLHIACGSMGLCTDDVVQRWEQSLNAEFNIIGLLVDSDVSESDEDSTNPSCSSLALE